MKRILFIIFSFSTFVILTCDNSNSQIQNESQTGIIEGKVTKASTNDPISGVLIKTEPNTKIPFTKSDGTYNIEDVPEGAYIITAKKEGYNEQSKNINVTVGNTVRADFSLAADVTTDFAFKMTTQKYLSTVDLDQVIQNEFGNDYRLADWNDVSQYCQAHSANQFVTLLSWPVGEPNSLLVTQNGLHYWNNTTRHFYITRFDHNITLGYLSHANIENHFIDLGSWSNITMAVLAVHK